MSDEEAWRVAAALVGSLVVGSLFAWAATTFLLPALILWANGSAL